MKKFAICLNILALSAVLAVWPAAAEKGKEKEKEAKPTYHSSIQAPKQDEDEASLRKLARISEKEATQTAVAKAGSAKLVETELENEDGNVVYVVKFKTGKQEREIVVDAGNGKILADQTEAESDKD